MKYKKTYHLPCSESLNNDDRMLPDVSCFENKTVVYTEKMDGECTACSSQKIHARSEDGYGKPWQTYMKRLYSCFANDIPSGMIIFGENVYAVHSIEYLSLPTCFFVFSIFERGIWLSWDDTVRISNSLGLDTAPEITRGPLYQLPIPNKSAFGPKIEGYVVRNVSSYKLDDFHTNVAKVVRKGHVQINSDHWTKTWRPAKFIEDPIERLYRKRQEA